MRYFNYILILLGSVIALYSKAGDVQNQYVLIGGIMVLMLGIYRLSRTIPSKNDDDGKDDTTDEL